MGEFRISDLLFVYGTLTDPRIRTAVLGHAATTSPAGLRGFRPEQLVCGDDVFPVLVEDPGYAGVIEGVVFRVGPADLRKLDRYEGRRYRRRRVILADGREAWAYTR